ncbi:hypothetical protein L914_05760 [Phytophthora nicotianae]|uniref:Uncharacterized protein n=1 Tax=Phytophthora nicotianae TaxID=4792 RepID=W2NNJ1_PHYNI|nr:hypothetical protein L914_05760 [Phytophthora nicotianae]
MGVSDELSAWLPYLIDDIYGNFSSDDEAKQVDSDTELTAVESGGGEAPRSRELVSERTTARREYSLVPYSTAIQRRKKAELHALRLEVQYLTTKLARFRQAPSEAQPVNRITKSRADHIELREWQNRATAECEKRIQAEHSNQKLKAILRRQFKVFQSVRKRLRQIDTHEELEFLKQLPIVDWPVFQPDFSDFILSELSSNLGHLRPQADFILPAPSPNISVTFHTQTGYIVGSGHCFEMTSITPLACTAREAGDLLWRFISSKDNNAAETIFFFCTSANPATCRSVRYKLHSIPVNARYQPGTFVCGRGKCVPQI